MAVQDDPGVGAAAPAPAPFQADPFRRSDPPLLALTLWPNRSLSRRGFAWVLCLVAFGLAVPLLPVLFVGGKVFLGLVPFSLAVLAALYLAIRRNYADGALTEELRLWPDLLTVVRREPRSGPVRRWQANPHWVRLSLRDDGPVERYLTLTDGGREIELGAFLSPEERERLHGELARALAAIRGG